MTYIPTPNDRKAFAALADVLIPEAEGMPAASQVEVHGHLLDRVLRLQPSLGEPLRRAIKICTHSEPKAAVETINRVDPEAMSALGLVATAGYYMSDMVRNRLGYPGQKARPAVAADENDYMQNDLLKPVIDRGPIYRVIPERDAISGTRD